MVHGPPFRSEGLACGDAAGNPDSVDPVGERNDGLGEVADLGRPVIHLDIDIRVVVCVPCRLNVLVPDALEIGRQPSGSPGGASQHVTAILEIQRCQSGIRLPFLHSREPLVSRHFRHGRISQSQGNPAHNGAMVLNMSRLKVGV